MLGFANSSDRLPILIHPHMSESQHRQIPPLRFANLNPVRATASSRTCYALVSGLAIKIAIVER